MRTISIGSCFSKRVAVKVAGAKLVSSVYHNRSDVLLHTLQTHGLAQRSLADICNYLSVPAEPDDPFSPYSILSNQSREGLGLHDLPNGIPLLQALRTSSVDLILLDNFVDLVGRLTETEVGNYFCKHERFVPPSNSRLGPRLLPDQAARNFEWIVADLIRRQPGALIVMLQFPINNYPSADRRQWGWDFRDALNLPDAVLNIPVRRVRADGVPYHFASSEYARYARQIDDALDGGIRFGTE
ncbi:hypothetical protein GOB98_28865 [Sinorhizobium meliloti]|nr:hypothetical protein [Sinorhizobium meliloti]MDW9980001.1 hypothetical protein [Sinorhizobium meliloti]MDX0296609.1 hypothetical protein [Sinorhizobium meliloti]